MSNEIQVKDIYNELTKRHYKLNKRNFIMNEIPKDLKIGICVTKHCENKIFEFLEKNGLIIKKVDPEDSRSLKYEGYFRSNPDVKLLPFLIKPRDVYKFLENGLMDAVVCYQDVLDNYPVSYCKLQFPNNEVQLHQSKICAISNQDFDITEFENFPDRKMNIFSEYIYLTSLWTEKRGIVAKITPVCGFTEGFLVQILCDVVVCVVETGATVKSNNLKVIDTIYQSELGIFEKRN
jgi:ATP phosphoribosyltransferase